MLLMMKVLSLSPLKSIDSVRNVILGETLSLFEAFFFSSFFWGVLLCECKNVALLVLIIMFW